MTSTPKDLAENVVATFKELLPPEIRHAIPDGQYHSLCLMVTEAISDNTANVLEQVEATLKTIRADIERPPLDL